MPEQRDYSDSLELDLTKQLGHQELLARVQRLVREDRVLTARLLVHLGEVDARALYRDQAYGSMFEYAVHGLHLSESEAFVRIGAARLGRKFPIVLHMLARGELHLSSIKLLAPVLTQDNLTLLEQARFKSKREVERLLVQHFAKPDVPQTIRRLPPPARLQTATTTEQPSLGLPMLAPQGHCERSAGAGDTQSSMSTNTSTNGCGNDSSTSTSTSGGNTLPPRSVRPRAATHCGEPLSEGRYKLQFTAEQRLYDKLKQAQELMRHQVPNGDIAVVFERALDLLIAQRKKQHFAATERPRSPTAARNRDETRDNPIAKHERPGSSAQPQETHSRHIPHAVRREVLARDGEQCSYVSSNGRRCQQRGRLEFHHRVPYARGGAATPDNIQLLCQMHNTLWAERDYGPAFIRQRISQQQARSKSSRASSQLVPERVLSESDAGLQESAGYGRLGSGTGSIEIGKQTVSPVPV
jgi:5-methylcytosine-specific restriction endonuclease McrA